MDILFVYLYISIAVVFAFQLPNVGNRLLTYRKFPNLEFKNSPYSLALVAGVAGGATLLQYPNYIDRLIALIFLLLLLLIAWIDWLNGYILNELTYGGMFIFVLIQAIRQPEKLPYYLLTSILTGFFLFLLAKASKGLGIGDAKLMAMSAMVISWTNIIFAFWFATISGLLYILCLQINGEKIHRKYAFPFGPHLALGIYLSFLYGNKILAIFFPNTAVLSTLLPHILY